MERLAPLMVLTVISLAFPAMAAGASDGDEVGPLSVRQSLIPMFGKPVFFPTNYFHEKHFPLTRLNPAVKPYLRAYLDDNRISSQFDPPYRRGAIWLLGLIGDEQDITRVDRLIQERLKNGDAEESASLLYLMSYIGFFAGSHERRGTKGIQVFIEKYGTPDAWAVKSEIGSPRSRELAVERCGNFLAAAYTYSRSSNVKSLVSRQDSKTGLPLLPQNRMAILQRQSAPVYDTLILECTVEQSKLEMYYRECFKTWGKDIERLIASVDTPDTRHRVQRDAGTQWESASMAGDKPAANGALSVEETLGAVFTIYEEGLPWNLFRNASHDAKPALYAILANKEVGRYHPNVWRILGYIGNGADAERMERTILHDFTGQVAGMEAKAFHAVCDALGLMCRRDIGEATAIIDGMCDPGYWKQVKFRFAWSKVKSVPPFEYECVSDVLYGYRLSGKADLNTKVESVLGSIDDPQVLKYMKYRIDPTRLAASAKHIRAAETRPVSPTLRKEAAALYRTKASLLAKSELLSFR